MESAAPNISHAFISYVHEDSDAVDDLVSFLEAAGIQVWRDRQQLWPGDEWKAQISRAIQRDALAFIACFSEKSVARAKSYQYEELVLAVEEYRQRTPRASMVVSCTIRRRSNARIRAWTRQNT